ncbi:MAG: hypothetical protein OEZ39_19050 [Gammaproteobacteria bacterium]|nr:hypothetical protein [Gammaproteobacteria bacterium]MDH5653963.1 hypothetical protein [Gammaproteobacteria bacterium]
MDIAARIAEFADLLSIAAQRTGHPDIYAVQMELVAEYRDKRKPFLATMPMRHQFYCEQCRLRAGEAMLYFENPDLTLLPGMAEARWGTPVGACVQLSAVELHGILVHDKDIPPALQAVLFGAHNRQVPGE